MKSTQGYDIECKPAPSAYNYLYNGKELQDEMGWEVYAFGFRYYDPVIARWNVPDPMAEEPHNFSYSPYNYCINNPLLFIDPNGMDWYQSVDDEGNIIDGGAVMWREGSDAIEGYTNIGQEYTWDLGDGVSITFDQNTPESMTETVLNEGNWETQREPISDENGNIVGSKNKEGEEGNCFYQSGQMVRNSGATSLVGTSNNINTTDRQTNYMNEQIGNGHSIMVHVDYNGDGVGDHWVAISSRTTNLLTQSSTYNFYDPGTVWQQSGTHSTNIFNGNNGAISGTTFYNGNTYTVTAVRKNQ